MKYPDFKGGCLKGGKMIFPHRATAKGKSGARQGSTLGRLYLTRSIYCNNWRIYVKKGDEKLNNRIMSYSIR
jgi:hypothetical protein